MFINPLLHSIFIIVCLVLSPSLGQRCVRVSQCRCEMSDNSGAIDLNSLASTNGNPRWTLDGTDGWDYSYNPCTGFTSVQFTGLAVLQKSQDNGYEYDLGAQVNEDFSTSLLDKQVSITYTAFDTLRQSNVVLICEPSNTEHKLEFLGELISTQYEFILTSPCACPGLCDANGIIGALSTPGTTPSASVATTTSMGQQCVKVRQCRCEMSDNSGAIDLNSLASTNGDPRWTLNVTDGWDYSYNPCTGFTSAEFTGLAVLQKSQDNSFEYDLGAQVNEVFSTSLVDKQVSITYTALDTLRSSNVVLICEPSNTEHKLEFLGELITLEYEFILTSPCACPGLCDANGIIGASSTPATTPSASVTTTTSLGQRCVKVRQCRCEMNDNSGAIDLNSLASINGDPRWTLNGTDGWDYSYNPCTGFTSVQFTGLAVLQKSQDNSFEYDLGAQVNEVFSTSLVDKQVSITYTALDTLRQSNVVLICEPSSTEHKLEFLGELISTQYEFILTSPCACPGLCDANGIVATTIAPKSTTSSTGTEPNNNNSGPAPPMSYWELVGATYLPNIFNDLTLLVFIVIALLVFKFVFGFSFSSSSGSGNEFKTFSQA